MSETKCSKAESAQVDILLEAFHHLMVQTMAMDKAPKEFDTGMKLHRSEIHTVQAIGQHEDINLTRLAAHMEITKGAASQMVRKLERKGLVKKEKRADNAKEVLLALTPLGWRGYHAHEAFHASMADAFKAHYGDSLIPKLRDATEALRDLATVIEIYEEQNQAR